MKIDYLYKMGGRESAARTYNRDSKYDVLKLTIESPGATVTHELSVPEAEAIANELMEYVNEIKELAKALKGVSV